MIYAVNEAILNGIKSRYNCMGKGLVLFMLVLVEKDAIFFQCFF